MQQIILIIHVIAAIGIISLVLLQHGKGADVGAAFGSGSSNTMFGSQGPMSFLMKLTGFLALIFFVTSLTMGFLTSRDVKKQAAVVTVPETKSITIPTVPESNNQNARPSKQKDVQSKNARKE
jgi:preprotein translocase subunit SecG